MEIKEFFDKHKITAYKLAQLTGYSQGSISRWKSGEIKMERGARQHLFTLDQFKDKTGSWPESLKRD